MVASHNAQPGYKAVKVVGTEETDQYLMLGINDLDCDEWMEKFSKVYKELIDMTTGRTCINCDQDNAEVID